MQNTLEHSLFKLICVATLSIVSLTSRASSISYIVNGGMLAGIDGLVVDTNTYNVSFIDGTYNAVFGDTFDPQKFGFNALTAAHALYDAIVTPKLPLPIYSSIVGIPDPGWNNTQWLIMPIGSYSIIPGQNRTIIASVGNLPTVFLTGISRDLDLSTVPYAVYAKFTPLALSTTSSATPLPADLWMVGSALAVGFPIFRRRQNNS